MKYMFFIAGLLIFSGEALSKEMIFYKYADGDGYSLMVATADEAAVSISVRDVIARKMLGTSFILENVSTEYYSVTTTPNIAFFGENLTQYKLTPTTDDRFSHIVWVDDKKSLIKTEIYDLSGKLMFALSNVDFLGNKKKSKQIADGKKNKNEAFFKGFSHMHTKTLPGDVIHATFSDGLNRFSVFINPSPESSGTAYKIVYGNYLMTKVVNGIEYTLLGSVSYSIMEEFVDFLCSSAHNTNELFKIETFPSQVHFSE